MSNLQELNENDLFTVTGGTTAAAPTGSVTYTCPDCGTIIRASTRDASVICPNVKCRKSFNIENGKLVPKMTRPQAALKPAGT